MTRASDGETPVVDWQKQIIVWAHAWDNSPVAFNVTEEQIEEVKRLLAEGELTLPWLEELLCID